MADIVQHRSISDPQMDTKVRPVLRNGRSRLSKKNVDVGNRSKTNRSH